MEDARSLALFENVELVTVGCIHIDDYYEQDESATRQDKDGYERNEGVSVESEVSFALTRLESDTKSQNTFGDHGESLTINRRHKSHITRK